MSIKVAIQGELGSFHHEAASRLFGADVAVSACATFREVFASVEQEVIGLTAVENSLYGSINEVYDLLEKHRHQIFAEIELSIHQNLIGLVDRRPSDDIREIYSHHVALAQCENYLEQHFPKAERIEFEDTAAAVRHIAELGRPDAVAIAGRAAAELYPTTKILAAKIEDNPVNFTRFIAIAPPSAIKKLPTINQPNSTPKSSIILTTSHRAGALYQALGVFDRHQINLTKLQSRPIIGQKWRYKFYLDFEANAAETAQVIADLRGLGNEVVLLGNY
ncbi:MAG: prephenate dehydratase [Candidatus Nomurabacteria bacterium]|jgi:prephenate dehydratase|nr:prephenate dehydratase [Candidatus Nomurabacteria bacterium]